MAPNLPRNAPGVFPGLTDGLPNLEDGPLRARLPLARGEPPFLQPPFRQSSGTIVGAAARRKRRVDAGRLILQGERVVEGIEVR